MNSHDPHDDSDRPPPMELESIDRLSALQLAQLLDLGAQERSLSPGTPSPHGQTEDGAAAPGQWNLSDLPAILRHQLQAPLLPDLLATPGAEHQRLTALVAAEGGNENTFLDHLTRPQPSIPLLTAIKEFARAADSQEGHPLQGAGSRVLYYAAIAAARLRLNARITRLSDEQLREGMEWALVQEGAEPLAPLFKEALDTLWPIKRESLPPALTPPSPLPPPPPPPVAGTNGTRGP